MGIKMENALVAWGPCAAILTRGVPQPPVVKGAGFKFLGRSLLADGGGETFVGAAAAAHVNAEALDFLIERGERDHEALGGFSLVPAGALEHVDDDAAL